MSTTAQAKFAPFEPEQRVASVVDHAAMTTEPVGAMLEADYFNAPPVPFAARLLFPCHKQLHLFDKTRIAQSCR
jgi:hypothetical protein